MKYPLPSCPKWIIDPKFKREIDILIDDVINSEMDLFVVMGGEEGTGKSFAARGLGRYIQERLRLAGIKKSFTPDNIHFRQKEYVEASKKGELFDIIVLDEGRGSLGRGKDKKTKEAVDWVSRCRFMRQFHIVCVPAYHDLAPYIGEWRMRALVQFKKSYYKLLSGEYRLKHGEYRLYCDLEGLRFHSRMRDYRFPKGWEAWSFWCAKEVFSPDELEHYNAKKHYYAMLEQDADVEKFVFKKKGFSPSRAEIYTPIGEKG